MQEPEAFYDARDERATADLIEELMATKYATPPPGILVPANVWKEQKRRELKEQLSTKPFRKRFSHGWNLVMSQLREHLSPADREKIGQELSQGAEHFIDVLGGSSAPSEDVKSFKDLLQISNECIEHIYQCGVRLAKAHAFKDAADVFFVLSILDHRRHNVWMALGLNEQQLGHMEPALRAYAMAMITDARDPWSYLRSAECYQSIGLKDDAKECLEACLAHTSHLPRDRAERVKKSAESFRAKLSKSRGEV